MTQDEMKIVAATAALEYVESGMVVGIGTGSTANHFIDLLATVKGKIDGTVASSVASEERLKSHGIPVMDLNSAGQLSIYVDGADESDKHLNLIKGGGGALTREKIVAGASDMFEALAKENINIHMISTSEIKVSVVVDEKYLELAVRSLHERFGLGET